MITLKELRERAGITQARAAKALDIDIRTLQRWERGDIIPGGANLKALEEWAEKLRWELRAGKIQWPWESSS